MGASCGYTLARTLWGVRSTPAEHWRSLREYPKTPVDAAATDASAPPG